MAYQFKLPDLGEGLVEGEITKWLVKPGDAVKEDQPICEVMTDKANVEIPSPVTGTVAKLNAKEGDVVAVGAVIVEIDQSGKTTAKTESKPAAKHQGAVKTQQSNATPAAKDNGGSAKSAAATGGTFEFRLPDIGEGLVEGEVTKWLVKPGDAVKEDQPVCELMTDKANVEIPSPVSGVVEKLLVKEGQVVPVHDIIMVINTSGKVPAARMPAPGTAKKEEKSALRIDPKEFEDQPLFSPTKKPDHMVKKTTAAPGEVLSAGSTASVGKTLAAPATRHLARELGVDLLKVKGSGPHGRVTAGDVREFAAGKGVATMAVSAGIQSSSKMVASGAERREPMRGLRRKIAEQMVKSKHTAPHYSYFEEVDVTELVKFREKAKEVAAKKGIKLTFMPFFMKAAAEALKKFPIVNSALDDAAQEIVYKEYYHIGIATATEQGLSVPVVKNVDKLNLFEVASETQRVSEAARAMKLSPEDAKGSTFTITNVGVVGGMAATPILNHPEVGIMGVNAIKKRPWVVDNRIEIRDIVILSMSFDHRVVDGAVGAAFTQEVIRYLNDPAMFLLCGI